MGYVVKMPKLGLEMEQGILLEWHVAEGDAVEEGDTIAEVESEKSIGEVDAREDGVLRLVGLEEGEEVPPGTPIGIVADPDEDISDLKAEFDTDDSPSDSEAGEETTATTSTASEDEEVSAGEDRSASETSDVKASPRAKQRAQDMGVDLSRVTGTGPQGAVTADDVEAAADAEPESESTTETEQIKASPRAERRAEELDVDLAGVDGSGPQGAITADDVEAAVEGSPDDTEVSDRESRETELERLEATPDTNYRTKTYNAHEGEASIVVETAERASKAFDFDVSPTHVLLLAVSAALDDHPEFNATFEDGTHHVHEQQFVEIASGEDANDESSASVIPDVGERTLTDIVEASNSSDAPADETHERHPTFVLTDKEGRRTEQGTTSSPTVAGLLADCSCRRAMPAENGVELQRYLRLELSYDARAIGDREADAFLENLLGQLERVSELVLRTYR